MNKILLNASKIRYLLPLEIVLLDEVSLSIGERDRIGLIGKNGSGKSTLLKILAGKIEPSEGNVNLNSPIYYLPQLSQDLNKDESVLYEYIGKSVENWWDVLLILEKEFGTKLSESQKISKLSGGELMKVNLAIGLVRKPKILLLDEPTNHLDVKSQDQLIKFVKEFNGAVVVVSHNTHFLDHTINQIWALENGKVSEYGGTYTDYRDQRDTKLTSDQRKYEQEKRKIKQLESVARQKRSQARESDKKVLRDPGIKGFAGKKARTAKIMGDKIQKRIEKVEETLGHAAAKTSYLDLSATQAKGGKALFRIENGELKLPNGQTLIQDVNIQVRYGDRIALCGANGTGKTFFVKNVVETESVNITGIKYKAESLSAKTIDQKYDLVNPEKTMIENVQHANDKLEPETVRRLLGNFQFKMDTEVNKKAKYLSGGEIAKADLRNGNKCPYRFTNSG